MAMVRFTPVIQRHIDCPDIKVEGKTIRQVLNAAFEGNPQARGYFLDDQGGLRTHVVIFVDGVPVKDRVKLSDPVTRDGEVYVMQSLAQ